MISSCHSPLTIAQAIFNYSSLSSLCMATLKGESLPTESTLGNYLLVFLLTCLLEAPIYYLAARFYKITYKRFILLLFVLNLATHPIVSWVLPWVAFSLKISTFHLIWISEVFAPLLEAIILKFWIKFSWRNSFTTAVVANLFSWWIGSLIY